MYEHFWQKLAKIEKFLFLLIFQAFSKIAKKCHFRQFFSKFLVGLYGPYMSSMVSKHVFGIERASFWAFLIPIIFLWKSRGLLKFSIFCPFLGSLSVSSSLSVSHRNFSPQKYSQNVGKVFGGILYFLATNLDQ